MEFTSEQKAKAEKILSLVKCPICGSSHIQFTDYASQIICFNGDFDSLDISKMRWLNAFCGVCDECGYIMQFSVKDVLK